ncbi:zinc-binding dehydrogenase [uncultured Amnibacterium sp.]|uniref:zinc-dependent alcohol dehydrogenase n=1 Tax=uncultured Amnibacterium sp. TaxID=1631851 RepID=UPI0035C9CA3E
MRAASITAPGSITVVDHDAPRAAGDLVVVRVLVAPLCTESKDRRAGRLGTDLGHEAAGVVVDAGTSQLVAVGQRVVVMPQFACGACWVCRQGDHIHCPNQRDVLTESGSAHGTGTIAQYVLKPDWLLLPVPDDIPLEHAAMACCGFGPTFTAHHRLRTSALDIVAVSGSGPVGLGAVAQSVLRGARTVVVEAHPFRAALARELGADTVIDPMLGSVAEELRNVDGRGPDAGIETSGAPGAAGALVAGIRPLGRVGIVAWTEAVQLPNLVPLGVEIHGCWHWNHQVHLEEMWRTIRRAHDAIDLIITHRFALEDIAVAMDLQDTGACGKVLVHPFGADEVTA